MDAVRQCRVCRCNDMAACITADGPCFWVEDDLCSACKGQGYGGEPAPDRRCRECVLRMMAGGPALPWGAAMAAALEFLSGRGLCTRGPNYQITEEGRAVLDDGESS